MVKTNGQCSRPALAAVILGLRPNSPTTITNVSLSRPLAFMSSNSAARAEAVGGDGRHEAEVPRPEVGAVGVAVRHERVVAAAEEARVLAGADGSVDGDVVRHGDERRHGLVAPALDGGEGRADVRVILARK